MSDNKLINQFRVEAREHLEAIERNLLVLEKEPENLEPIRAIFQAVHGIKGTSDYVGLKSINHLCHHMETLLNKLRRETLKITPELVDRIFKGIDLLSSALNNVENPIHGEEEINRYTDMLNAINGGEKAKPASPKTATALPKDNMIVVFMKTAGQHMSALASQLDRMTQEENVSKARSVLERTIKTFRASANYLGYSVICNHLDLFSSGLGTSDGVVGDEQMSLLRQELQNLEEVLEKIGEDKVVETEDATAQEDPGEVTKSSKQKPSLKAKNRAEKLFDQEESTLRVPMEKLDRFMNLVSELVAVKNSMAHLGHLLEEKNIEGEIQQQTSATTQLLNKLTDQLQEQLMSIRLIPISFLFDNFSRTVRDQARKYGKDVRLNTQGANTELDKGVADLMHEPLMHLVRNSIAHGIESPDERSSKGKPETGEITIKAEHEGSFISMSVSDDGAGLNMGAIAKKAIDNGLIEDRNIEELSERELINLLFQPGFSTATSTDGLSGRGVGLDVVRTNINKVGGSVDVTFVKDVGTTFQIKIPLTLAVIRTMVVAVGSQRYAIPSSFVEESLRLDASRISMLNGFRTIIHKGHPVPLMKLGDLLGVAHVEEKDDGKSSNEKLLISLILNIGSQRYGVIVDTVLIQQDVLIRPLSSSMLNLPQFSGATVMSDGGLILIINPMGLMTQRNKK